MAVTDHEDDALEQTLTNALTGLPIGVAKGGANFNPKGESDASG